MTTFDPRVDAAWRALSDEEPPRSLDAAIMAAARREVGARPQKIVRREAMAHRRRWWPLAAAATVAAIAVGVLQLTTPDQIGAPASDKTIVSDVPAPAARPAPALPLSAQRARESAAAPSVPLAKMGAGRAADARAGDARTDEARATDRAPLPVADWIALIRRLRDEGKSAEAGKELAAFRAAHADHEKLLPPDLRNWQP